MSDRRVGADRRVGFADDILFDLHELVDAQQPAHVAPGAARLAELRAELADRATANVHAEAKIREVETEFLASVQAFKEDSGAYAIPGEFVTVRGRRTQ